MKQEPKLALTISRMLGSGGTWVAQMVARELDILYLDREILEEAARSLQVKVEDAAVHDERADSIWESIFLGSLYDTPFMYAPPNLPQPTDWQLFGLEADIIRRVADDRPAVIVGRGGAQVLKDCPHHASIFLHASRDFRIRRIQEQYGLSPKEAAQRLDTCDEDRGRHWHKFTGTVWTDARQYSLCLDTGTVGLEAAVDLIVTWTRRRFGI